ncbi:hypothetical protein PRK78_006092 [Emydomyces testavorans]|uniref:SprT-like domain-containing protein n=1 Tax=Emydomyces testavorans TaxID=2070801 RepID=A0AAF0DPL4_9EURO|nr:hypothetical protein PRK78_006092 [Emydomyces testavorans]
MARLRKAPLKPSAASATTSTNRAHGDAETLAFPVDRKSKRPAARSGNPKPTIVIHEDKEEEVLDDCDDDDNEEKRDNLGYLDLSAEESDMDDDSESDGFTKNEDDYDEEGEEINLSIEKEELAVQEVYQGEEKITPVVKSKPKRTLRQLGVNGANTLFQSRRVSCREESRYNDYISDDENISAGSGNYEKENDEKGLFNETKSSAHGNKPLSHRSEIPRRSGRNTRKPSLAAPSSEEEEETNQNQDSEEFDSLDDFIVGDDEDISYCESTEDEAEESEEEIISKPRVLGRRLFRGRKPALLQDAEKNTKANTNNTTDAHGPSELDGLAEKLRNTKLSKTELHPTAKFSKEFRELPEKKTQEERTMDDDDDSESLAAPPQSPQVLSKGRKAVEFVTPPGTPSKPRLQSPKKTPKRIPPSPYRPSIDSFWSQDIINTWNDEFSPKKSQIPRKWLPDFAIFDDNESNENVDENSPLSSPEKAPPRTPKKSNESPTKSIAAIKKSEKREFDKKKASLADEFFKELDNSVTGGEIQKLAAATGGVQIIWSKKLNTTAGRANWKREHIKQKRSVQEASSCFAATPDSSKSASTISSTHSSSNTTYRHHASIELADKVVDSDDRLFNTLAHEYCHLANYMISNVRDNPHGASFKEWALKCKKALDAHPSYAGRVEITAKHSYVINYKYIWCCVDCGHEYGRHSKSIDPEKSRCGKCKGKLVQIQPKPRKTAEKKREGLKELVEGDLMAKSMGTIQLNS